MFNKILELLNEGKLLCEIILVIISGISFFIYLGIVPVLSDNTLNIINLLVQSEAAVIAIVITLSLVAVQLASSSYSTRVMDVFKKSLSFWTIVILYISSIITGLVILILIDNGMKYGIQNLILINYTLGIVSFISLIPFILITFDLLKPSTLIKRLAKDITQKNILLTVTMGKDYKKNDPIQPIMDIVHSSLIRYDYGTVRECFNSIEEQIETMMENKELKNEETKKILNFIFDHYQRAGLLAINQNDNDSAREIVDQISFGGQVAAENNLDDVTKKSIASIFVLGDLAARKNNEDISMWISDSLNGLAEISVKNKLKHSESSSVFYMGTLGKIAAKQKFDKLTGSIAVYLGDIGKLLIESEYEYSFMVSQNLKDIGSLITEEQLQEASQFITDAFDSLIKAKLKNNQEWRRELYNIIEFGKKSAENGFDEGSKASVSYVLYFVKNNIINFSEEDIQRIISQIMSIEDLAAEKNLVDTFDTISRAFHSIGEISIEKKYEDVAKFLFFSLIDIAQKATKYKIGSYGATFFLEEFVKLAIKNNINIPIDFLIKVFNDLMIEYIETDSFEAMFSLIRILELLEDNEFEKNIKLTLVSLRKSINKDLKYDNIGNAKLKLKLLEMIFYGIQKRKMETLNDKLKECMQELDKKIKNLDNG